MVQEKSSGGLQLRGSIVALEQGAVQISLANLPQPELQYPANWFKFEKTSNTSSKIHFGQTVPVTNGLSTILSIELNGDIFDQQLENANRDFHRSLTQLIELKNARIAVPTIDEEHVKKYPPKSHLVYASIPSLSYWDMNAEASFYYLSPSVFQKLKGHTEKKVDKLVQGVVLVKLSSPLLLELLDQIYGKIKQ